MLSDVFNIFLLAMFLVYYYCSHVAFRLLRCSLFVFVCWFFFFLMIRRPPRSTQSRSSAASDVYKRQALKRALRTGSAMGASRLVVGEMLALVGS